MSVETIVDNRRGSVEASFFFDKRLMQYETVRDILESKCFFKAEKYYLDGAGRSRHFKHLDSLLRALRRAREFKRIYAYVTETHEHPILRLVRGVIFDKAQFNLHEKLLPAKEFFDDFISLSACNGGYVSRMDDLMPWQKPAEAHPAAQHTEERRRRTWRVPGFRYSSAWRMWFARRAFEHFPRERILSFKDCVTAEETLSGGVFVQLYPSLGDCDDPKSIERKSKLERWLDFPGVEERADASTHETGRLPSGRTYVITWVDPDKNPVIKPEATHAVISWQAGGALIGERHEPKDIAAAIADDPSVLDGPLEPDLDTATAEARFDLRLISYPGNKVQVIRALAGATERSLSEAKRLVERGPCYVLVNRPADEVRRARSAFQEVGAEIVVQVAKPGARIGG